MRSKKKVTLQTTEELNNRTPPNLMTLRFNHLRNSVFLLFLLCIFYQTSWAQSCNGAAPGPITGGLNNLTKGDLCSNSSVNPGVMRINVGNVDDVDNPAFVSFLVDWNDGNTVTLFHHYPPPPVVPMKFLWFMNLQQSHRTVA